jgi:hypothetical protein
MGHGKKPKGHAVAPKQTKAPSQDDLFLTGYDFLHKPPGAAGAGTKARIWASKSAGKTDKYPLIIYLHGNNNSGKHPLRQEFPPLLGPKADARGFLHAGKLLAPEIANGNVVPLVVASLSLLLNGAELWTPTLFDLSTFVQEVQGALAGFSFSDGTTVTLDLDNVAVTAHSGGGGNPGNGLSRVVEQKGRFSVDKSSHELTLVGVMDTRTDAFFGDLIRLSLSKNVDVYAVHRLTGGWNADKQSHEKFCKGLTRWGREEFVPDAGLEQEQALVTQEKPCCDSANAPLRVSIAVVVDDKAWTPYQAQWGKLPGAYKFYGWEHHFDIIPLWTLWAARRYFSPKAIAAKKARPKASACYHCDALQAMVNARDVATRLQAGSKDAEAVEHLQFLLTDFGYLLPGPLAHPSGIDGDFGPGTVKQLAAFLGEIGMTGDGKSVTPDIAKAVIDKHNQGFKTVIEQNPKPKKK